MAEHLMVDEAGFRFGLGGGLLFVTSGAVVASGAPPDLGVGTFLAVTALTAFALDLRYALAQGLVGWAFATGFAVNGYAILTLGPSDLLRLVGFVLTAALAAWVGRAR